MLIRLLLALVILLAPAFAQGPEFYGMDENRQGKLFNAAVLIDAAGQIMGSHSKVHLQNWMLASGVNQGDGFQVWDVEIAGVKAKIGIQSCYDV